MGAAATWRQGQRARQLALVGGPPRTEEHAVREDPTDFEAEREALILLAERRQFGPSTQAIIDEAASRDIPFIRLNRHSLVQLGQGIHQQRVMEVYGVPEEFHPAMACAVGYAGEVRRLPEEFCEREMQPRSRAAFKDFVFGGQFGTPADLFSSQLDESREIFQKRRAG